jgi:flagellar basal-body rod protein FlgC
MASMFQALDNAASGMRTHRKWLDAVADNIANVSTARRTSENAYQARYVVAQSRVGGGSSAGSVEFGDAEGRLVFNPDHPLADRYGYIRMPDIDLGEQMVELLMAQRGYQANLSAVERARDAYMAALQIGK